MLDGIHVDEHLVLVALGIDERAEKHILGLYEGATENTTSCSGVCFRDLEGARCAHRSHDALRDRWQQGSRQGDPREIRSARSHPAGCQVHKKRNVEDHLPEDMKRNAGPHDLCGVSERGNPTRAKRMLEGLARQLERKHPSAAASLREGLDDTLTVMRFDLDAHLARTLSTTNPIEFLNGRIRKTTHNVARWDGGEMGSFDGSPLLSSKLPRHSAS